MPKLPSSLTATLNAHPPRPIRNAPPMPMLVLFTGSQNARVSMEMQGDELAFAFRSMSNAELSESPYEDPEILCRRLIDWFVGVKTPQEALSFLSATGHFLWDAKSEKSEVLTWSNFQEWQQLIRDISEKGFLAVYRDEATGNITTPPGWVELEISDVRKALISNVPDAVLDALIGVQPVVRLNPRYIPNPAVTQKIDELNKLTEAEGRPATSEEIERIKSFSAASYGDNEKSDYAIEMEALTTIQAMLMRIWVEDLDGVEYRKCKRKGCGKLFEKKYKHEKKYCSEACAHHDHVKANPGGKGRKPAKRKVKANG